MLPYDYHYNVDALGPEAFASDSIIHFIAVKVDLLVFLFGLWL